MFLARHSQMICLGKLSFCSQLTERCNTGTQLGGILAVPGSRLPHPVQQQPVMELTRQDTTHAHPRTQSPWQPRTRVHSVL